MALIFGIAGALRRQEFADINVDKDVTKLDDEDILFIRIIKTKNNVPRLFTVTEALFHICSKYIQARLVPCSCDRFFLKYSNEKCI